MSPLSQATRELFVKGGVKSGVKALARRETRP